MYADKEEVDTNRSIKDRLNANSTLSSSRRPRLSAKRGREDDDKWEHDLFEGDESRISNGRVRSQDLRLKLQSKGSHHGSRSVRGSVSGGVRDLREKLSGITAEPMDIEPPRRKQKTETEVSTLSRRSVIEAPVSETKRVASTVSKKNTQPKRETVDSFLESLGLEKYSITFQAEEVDMTALIHMNDEDLKAMSIPMGPRKKIILALDSNCEK